MQLELLSQHASTSCVCMSSLFAAQIQPEREIITEYIKNDEFKYVRILGELPPEGHKAQWSSAPCMEPLHSGSGKKCRRPCICCCNCCSLHIVGSCVSSYLPYASSTPHSNDWNAAGAAVNLPCHLHCVGAFYLRLVARPTEIYNYLEPLYNDYRKLRIQNQDGTYTLSHVDAIVDQMLHSDYLFDIALPRLPTRSVAWFIPSLQASCSTQHSVEIAGHVYQHWIRGNRTPPALFGPVC